MFSITFKLIVLKQICEYFNFPVFVLFCLIVTKPFYLLVHIFLSFLVVYKLFCLVFGLSDGLMTLLLNFGF